MENLKNNQILIEVSEDKKIVTVTLGSFTSIRFEACPAKITEYLGNAISAYFRKTGLNHLDEWENGKCAYENGEGCKDCN